MNNATPMLEIKGVSKYFGSTVANKDINLTVNKGEILALLGENGSGKNYFDEHDFRHLLPRRRSYLH